jgi:hypothetical protein
VPLDQRDLDLEQRLTREARRFELKPLLDLLLSNGYRRDQILFESTAEGSSSTMVVGVEFRENPQMVVVTLSLGLLGDNSLLPSYFLQIVEKSDDPERFFDFLRFFDHRLIENFLRAVYPEDDGAIYKDFPEVERAFLKMLGLGSVSTLEWLSQLHFPELRARVARRAFSSATASHAFRTGRSALDGTGILGRVYESDAAGFVLDLVANEETDMRGRGWATLVQTRLRERLLPTLAPFRIPLIVRLHVLFHASWARVDFPFADEHGYLGYERFRGDPDQGHTMVLYRGNTGETVSA